MKIYYLTCFILSVLTSLFFVWRWSRRTDVYFALIFATIPMVDLGYFNLAISENLREALATAKLTYIGGCFLTLFITLSLISMCRIKVSKFFVISLFSVSYLIYISTLTIGYNGLLYKSVDFEVIDGVGTFIHKVYGPMHTIFYANMAIHVALGIAMIIYSFKRKREISIRSLVLYSVMEMACIMSYVIVKVAGLKFEVLPFTLLVCQFIILFIMGRTELYNISRTQADILIEKGESGFLSMDRRMRYIGSNPTVRRFFPELDEIRIDSDFCDEDVKKDSVRAAISSFVEEFKYAFDKERKETATEHIYERDDHIYRIVVEHLMFRGRIKGYQISVIDETDQRKYTRLLEGYNDRLQKEVEEKTEHIQEIQDKMVLGLATMVESRDESTGGHVKRTSHVVGILIKAIKKDGLLALDDEFCKCIVKAAPLHDIGKIAVEDKILTKKGRFEPWEYEIMKTHAAKGAKLVKEVLADVEEPRFQVIAENVAHYHHERWDGSGYPEGLKGEQIPIEARIMAVADVYDALVSKRCYKEKMSFEEAYNIIEDGMGKHFDERLNRYFVESREKLEDYYRSEEAREA